MRYFIGLVASGYAVLAMASSATATTFVYNLNQTPGQLPDAVAPPWTNAGAGTGGAATQSASGNTLTLVNTSPGRGYFYYRDGAPVASLDDNLEYEIRARATPTTDYSGSSVGGVPIFVADIFDGTQQISFGMAYDNAPQNTYVFYFTDSGLGPIGTTYSQAAATDADGFFNIRLAKTGTTGTAADTVSLYVDDDVVPRLTLPYTSFAGAGGNKQLDFGQKSGDALGTALVNGVTFGIGEPAPLIEIPEPSTVMLAGLGALLVLRRRRR